ncbi:hypothetical protein H0H93_005219 [Arthromyces matolae]|nr:hypothetical protein H0H93_005219 [Arthromyces matolae]
MATLAGAHHPEFAKLREDVQQYKEESAKSADITHHHNLEHPNSPGIKEPAKTDELHSKLAEASLDDPKAT